MKKLVITLVIFSLLVISIFVWWQRGLSAVNKDKTQQVFVIEKNEGIRDIGYTLKDKSLITDPIVFFLQVKLQGLEGKIQAGDFRLSSSMTLPQILQTLTHGTLDIWVTIPEGFRSTEIAEKLATKVPTYKAAWRQDLVAQEGYLFPDTYLFPTNTDVNQIISIMKNNFEQKYAVAASNKTTSLTKEEVVILASILQREGKSASDMKLIASVMENRLNLGMALQVDSTIQYALGYQPTEKTWWKTNLTPQDLKIDSPYNTYLNPGLPPTPICNPGLDALTAVLNPAQTDYLYYISDKNGVLHFAKTLEEHNANIQKYL